MKLNAEFNKRVVMRPGEMEWTPSPVTGVDRKPLDRIGEEVARATTIVRFSKDSAFSAHVHGGGEEFLVLAGVFQDEHGDFPAGSYIRNPPTSRHTPRSKPGCTIFVKLWQFDPQDRTELRVDTNTLTPHPDPERPGVRVTPLFHDTRERVRLEVWAPGTSTAVEAEGGAEVLVLDGQVKEAGETLNAWDWLRTPIDYPLTLTAGPQGARLWIKSGHLHHVAAPPAS